MRARQEKCVGNRGEGFVAVRLIDEVRALILGDVPALCAAVDARDRAIANVGAALAQLEKMAAAASRAVGNPASVATLKAQAEAVRNVTQLVRDAIASAT